MAQKSTYRMKVIPEPEEGTRTVFICAAPGVSFEGTGTRNYQCGTCGKMLIRKIRLMQIIGAVYQCGKCDAYNEIPTAHQGH